MSSEVMVAIVSLIGTLGGTMGGIVVSAKLTNFRLEQLERKQEKYNTLVERTFKLEEHAELTNEKFRVANHRIEDLERKVE